MAKSTITQITDDIDGSADAETVSFAFQGASYSIDLAAKNLDKLTKALAPFIEHASKTPRYFGVDRTQDGRQGRPQLRPRAAARMGRQEQDPGSQPRPHPGIRGRPIPRRWRPLTQRRRAAVRRPAGRYRPAVRIGVESR